MKRKEKALLKKKLQDSLLVKSHELANEAETEGLFICGAGGYNNFQKIVTFSMERKYMNWYN
jgi:hypothetical protein